MSRTAGEDINTRKSVLSQYVRNRANYKECIVAWSCRRSEIEDEDNELRRLHFHEKLNITGFWSDETERLT